MTDECATTSRNTKLINFAKILLDYIYDSLAEAQHDRASRSALIVEAKDGYVILMRRLARDDTSHELKAVNANIIFALDDFFRFANVDNIEIDEQFERRLVESLARIDWIKTKLPS